MNDVFYNHEDLTAALVGIARGYDKAILVPTIEEQLAALIAPGYTVGFRTESGSHYEASMYSTQMVRLHKVVHGGPGGYKEVAAGELIGTHDRKRGVCGLMIKESTGRTYMTSAIVKCWMSYDAINNKSYQEPA